MTPFFITGLPRSRTAWLANFFTTQTAFCFHDRCKDGWTAAWVEQSLKMVAQGFVPGSPPARYTHVGDADSGLMLIAPQLVVMFPDARWLFVKNTPQCAADKLPGVFQAGQRVPRRPAAA